MNTLNISGNYYPDNEFLVTIDAEEAAKLCKVISLKTKFKQDSGSNEKAIFLFFILIKNGTQTLPDQHWENDKLRVRGTLDYVTNNEDLGAIVIYDKADNLPLYDENFEDFLKEYIKDNVKDPRSIELLTGNFVDRIHFQSLVRNTIENFKLMLVTAFGKKDNEYTVPPTQVGSGGILKPGSR
jgi:hypothetical protein